LDSFPAALFFLFPLAGRFPVVFHGFVPANCFLFGPGIETSSWKMSEAQDKLPSVDEVGK